VAQGRVVFYDGPDRLVGDRIDYNLRTGTGVVYNGASFSAPYYHLSGERMERVGERVYQVRGGVFTTCEADDPPWSFRFGSATAELDEMVSGRDVSFWIGKIPLIPWIPYFAAAIRRERQSGFLFPSLGVSNRKGFFAKLPYFWAIDDSQDLTVSLDTYTRLGPGLEAEYRYILSGQARGTAGGFVFHEIFDSGEARRDREQDRRNALPRRESVATEETRGYLTVKHQWQIDPRLSFRVDAGVTSDDFVFREYGDRLHDRTTQRAETNVFLTRRWDAWNLAANVLWYQDLTSDRPVELQRVPEIRLQGVRQPVPGLPALLYETEASFTNFIRDVGADGVRGDLHPRVFLPLPVAGVFTVTPFLGGRATYYSQRVVGQRVTRSGGFTVEETVDENRLRRQAEAGLELESRAARVYGLHGAGGMSALQHVVEPRAVYTEIRGEEQKALPQYDPAIDQIGKVSEVTYSLTNRLNAKTVAGADQQAVRWELARLVVSQTYSLRPADEEPFKDLRGDLILQPNQRFRFRGDARLNVHGQGLREANADIGGTYGDVSASVGARFNEQAAARFVRADVGARLTAHLEARGSTSWDVKAGVPVENRVGLDLRFQCWAVMLEYVDRHRNEDEVRFAVNLLGVGQYGSRVGTGIR